ncbi:helix-turn-helix domain-containing protein [Kitasatospora sp. NPDC001547]|uniref:helix-turn-helix domain-containing protein n=1 Tax=Kitasatospora sp. NPDC001547 TaxID=3364015 RepID=UPI003674F2C3|nr:helix-turn-helix transcriptional regulator [Kitasatospora sp. Xyl93]
MSTPKQNPMSWRYCGDQVKRWRTLAGVSREQLSQAAHYDIESVRSMEAGRRKPTLQLLQAADELCDAKGMLLGAATFMTPEKFPSYLQGYTDAEASAIAIHTYEALLIPGLLQTEEYARELISHSLPPLDDDTVEARVAGRMQRQEKLANSPRVLFGFVIYEVALRAKVGSADLMKRQLAHIIDLSSRRNVAVQVLPANRAAYPALTGPITLLETADREELAYVEGHRTGVLHADPDRVNVLKQRHGMIRMQALSVEESVEFIGKVSEEL